MTFSNSTSNLCIFCYKNIPPEYHNDHHDQNMGKVNRFCAVLSRFVNCDSINIKRTLSSFLSNSLFSSCEDCETILTQFSSIYHKMKCLELQLFWKLESLGKLMNLADKVVSSTKLELVESRFVKEDTDSNSGISQPNLKAFKTFRTKIKKKCKDGRKMSTFQPRVSLKRLDQNDDNDYGDKLTFKAVSANGTTTEDSHSKHLLNDNTLVTQTPEEDTTRHSSEITITTHPLPFKIKSDLHYNEHLDTEADCEDPAMSNDIANTEFSTDSNLFLDEEDHDHVHSISNQHFLACKMNNCANRFKTKADLARHQMLSHPQDNITVDNTVEKLYHCQSCGKSFKKRCLLANHLEWHKNRVEWKFECLVCGKKCAVKSHLQKHMTSHSEERKWTCQLCGRAYKTIEFLKTHLKSHKSPNEWKFECGVCKKKFVSKQNLERHAYVHTEERPFECKQCGKGYKCLRDLRAHLRSSPACSLS